MKVRKLWINFVTVVGEDIVKFQTVSVRGNCREKKYISTLSV